MKEYFVVMNSFAAPFFSDSSSRYVNALSPKEGMEKIVAEYTHPCGLYSAFLYNSADDYHKGIKPVLQYLSNTEIAKREATKGRSCYSFRGLGLGNFEIDGKRIVVNDPKDGQIVQQ